MDKIHDISRRIERIKGELADLGPGEAFERGRSGQLGQGGDASHGFRYLRTLPGGA